MTTHFQDISKLNKSARIKKIKNFLLTDDDPACFEELLRRQIPDELKLELEGLLTVLELQEALFEDMKPNSAPGINVFFCQIPHTLAPLIIKVINYMKKGKLSISHRTAIMKLLQKGNMDPTNTNNFRPIILLSAIYKIASCAISNRLKKTKIHHWKAAKGICPK